MTGAQGTTSASHRVLTQLSKEPLTLGGIRSYLEGLGVKMSKDGVIKFLNKFEKEGMIKKKYHANDPPIYYLSKKGQKDIGLTADDYKHYAVFGSLHRLEDLLENDPMSETDEKLWIKKVLEIIGLYSMSAYLFSWRYEEKPGHFEGKRPTWCENVGVPMQVIQYLDSCLQNFWEEKETDSWWKKLPDHDWLSEIVFNKKAIKRLSKTVHTLYPKEMKEFDRIHLEVHEKKYDIDEYFKKNKSTNRS